MIRPDLRDIINDHKTPVELSNNRTTSAEWKIELNNAKQMYFS